MNKVKSRTKKRKTKVFRINKWTEAYVNKKGELAKRARWPHWYQV